MKRGIVLLLILLSCSASAQKKDSFWRDLNDFLNMRADKAYAKTDTNYVGRYPYHWDARLYYKTSGIHMLTTGVSDMDLSTGMSNRVGVGISYRGLGISYSKAIGRKLNLDLGLDTYGRHFCLEYTLRASTDLSGTIGKEGRSIAKNEWLLVSNNLNLFWSFNPRFSYAAAMKQTKIQRRSAGSVLIGFSWSLWDVFDTDVLLEQGDTVLSYRLLVDNYMYNRFSIGAGYGYNLVLGDTHWLIHASLIPMWTVFDFSIRWNEGERSYTGRPIGNHAFSGTARAGVYYRWGTRWSAGISGVVNQMASFSHWNTHIPGRRYFGAQDWQARFTLTFRF